MLFILLLALDQISKRLLLSFSPLKLALVQNTGIAFGLMQHNTLLIIGLNILLLVLLVVYRNKLFGSSPLQKWSFAFILAGGVGNLLDRLLLGFVVDFIHVWNIPVFNLADIYINIGILLLIAHLFLYAKKRV